MQKLSLDDIDLTSPLVLARPIVMGKITGYGAGVSVTEKVIGNLRRLGFTEVWVRGEDEAAQQVYEDDDETPVSQAEKFMNIKDEIADSLAGIMTEKDPHREMLRIKQINRGYAADIMKKGVLTVFSKERPSLEMKTIKQFSEAVLNMDKLQNLLSYCRNLIEGPFSMTKIEKITINLNDNRTEDTYLFNHMANCGMYFLATVSQHNAILKKRGAVSSELKYSPAFDHKKRKETIFYFSDDEILSGTIGAFLHDVGYLHAGMPELLSKDGALTREEHGILQKHVEVSMNMVYFHTFFATRPLSINVIENHHERIDGTGYPKKRTDFHTFSKILAIIDCFDSLTTDRPWRKKFPRSKVLQWLYHSSEEHTLPDGTIKPAAFDRDLVIAFEHILNLYEINEMAELFHVKSPSPVFKCVIKEQNPGRPDRPIVELLHCHADPNKDVAGKTLNLLNSTDLYLGESTDFKKDPIY